MTQAIQTSSRIHWLGAGLSSRPGFEHLARTQPPGKVLLWNRSLSKAQAWLEELGLPGIEAREFSLEGLSSALHPGDIAVSMLPADLHPMIARLCLDRGAHLVTTSYLSPQMKTMDPEAKRRGLTLINEVGLDPGIDHLFAHSLFDRMRARLDPTEIGAIDFHSFCGGFPETIDDEFRYRFSWSPLGVLRALKNPARWREQGRIRESSAPYALARSWHFGSESLEVYPNRDSEAYVAEYGFGELGHVLRHFMRGTLRPDGWQKAWAPIFREIETASPESLAKTAQALHERYAYGPGQRDRVVMEVRLSAYGSDGEIRFDESWRIDQTGDAMAKLVSYPAAVAVESVLEGILPSGVHGAPRDSKSIHLWFERLKSLGCRLEHQTSLPAGESL